MQALHAPRIMRSSGHGVGLPRTQELDNEQH